MSGRHIDLTSKDIDQLETYKTCLGIEDIKIGTKRSGAPHFGTYYRVQFGDVLFYEWLQQLGLSPNKSTSLKAVTIPDEYFLILLEGSGMEMRLSIAQKISAGKRVL